MSNAGPRCLVVATSQLLRSRNCWPQISGSSSAPCETETRPTGFRCCHPPSVWQTRRVRTGQQKLLNLSELVDGRSWCICERVGIAEAPLLSQDWRRNREEMHSSSASVYALGRVPLTCG